MVVKVTDARTVAALEFVSTVVKETYARTARTVAALASASTVVEETNARTVAALASASMVVEETNARTVAALASASTVVENPPARTAMPLLFLYLLRSCRPNHPSLYRSMATIPSRLLQATALHRLQR